MSTQALTPLQVAAYHKDGYIIMPSFLKEEEVEKLYAVAIEDDAMRKHSYDLNDQSGKKTKLALWFTPGDDAYGLLTRSQRIVNAVDQLLDDSSPVCHFHSKLMQKEPKVGGAWEWHQDYGYKSQQRERMPSGYQRFTQIGQGRARLCRRAGRRLATPCWLVLKGDGSGVCRSRTRRCSVFPC